MTKNEFDVPAFISDIKLFSPSEKLMIFSSRGDSRSLSNLIKGSKEINFNLSDSRGFTPLHFACINGYDDIIDLLVVQDNINLNQLDKMARPAIHLAWMHKRFSAAKKLMEAILLKHKSYLGQPQRDRFIEIIFSNQNDILGQVQDISKILDIEIEDLEKKNQHNNLLSSFYL